MSLIACTSQCVYQQDGCCQLDHAARVGQPCAEEGCVNFIPRAAEPQAPGQAEPKR